MVMSSFLSSWVGRLWLKGGVEQLSSDQKVNGFNPSLRHSACRSVLGQDPEAQNCPFSKRKVLHIQQMLCMNVCGWVNGKSCTVKCFEWSSRPGKLYKNTDHLLTIHTETLRTVIYKNHWKVLSITDWSSSVAVCVQLHHWLQCLQ